VSHGRIRPTSQGTEGTSRHDHDRSPSRRDNTLFDFLEFSDIDNTFPEKTPLA
jgi:hypothetical protein